METDESRISRIRDRVESTLEQGTVSLVEVSQTSATALTNQHKYYLTLYNSISVLIFGIIVLLLITYVIRRTRDLDASKILRLYGTPIILIMAVFLVVGGWDKDQLTPVVGLLGTIAGYLLGSTHGNSKNDSSMTES